MMKKQFKESKSLNSEFSLQLLLRSQERIEESNETQEGIFLLLNAVQHCIHNGRVLLGKGLRAFCFCPFKGCE